MYHVTKPLTGHPEGCVERWSFVNAYSSYGGARTERALPISPLLRSDSLSML